MFVRVSYSALYSNTEYGPVQTETTVQAVLFLHPSPRTQGRRVFTFLFMSHIKNTLLLHWKYEFTRIWWTARCR